MYILVDGYNVLKQTAQELEISERRRQQFINQMRIYAHNKGHQITVVFDGGPDVWPTRHQKQGVIIIYSGTKQSADDVIKKIIDETKNKELLVVSSDNELGRYAMHNNATIMESMVFYTILMQAQKPESKNKKDVFVKTSSAHNPFMDQLIQESRMPAHTKDEQDVYDNKRKSPADRPSKKERELLKKVKKL